MLGRAFQNESNAMSTVVAWREGLPENAGHFVLFHML